MTNTNAAKCNMARIAGLLFLLSLIVPLFNWALVISKFIVAGNAIDTAQKILANEFLFRMGIVNDLITSIVVLALALLLYAILKPINKELALFACFLKVTEGSLWAVITLGNFVGLLLLKEQTPVMVGYSEPIRILVGSLLNVHMAKTSIAGIFLGLSSMVFFYLFFKSRYVPRILAGFGIFSYGLIFIYDSMAVLSPNYAEKLLIQIFCWSPSIIFELIIGSWLLVKGINLQRELPARDAFVYFK